MINKTSTRIRIHITISNWFTAFKPGDQLTTDEVVKHVHNYISKAISPETIRRELRYMRQDGLINYKPVGQRKERIIQIL